MLKIFGDFNRLDSERRVRLDTTGSKEDMEKLGGKVREGLRVLIDSGDFEAEGVLEFSGGIWRARIFWDTARDK